MRKYKFIHPFRATEYIIECEEIRLSDGYWECWINEKIHYQFSQSYAMIKLK